MAVAATSTSHEHVSDGMASGRQIRTSGARTGTRVIDRPRRRYGRLRAREAGGPPEISRRSHPRRRITTIGATCSASSSKTPRRVSGPSRLPLVVHARGGLAVVPHPASWLTRSVSRRTSTGSAPVGKRASPSTQSRPRTRAPRTPGDRSGCGRRTSHGGCQTEEAAPTPAPRAPAGQSSRGRRRDCAWPSSPVRRMRPCPVIPSVRGGRDPDHTGTCVGILFGDAAQMLRGLRRSRKAADEDCHGVAL